MAGLGDFIRRKGPSALPEGGPSPFPVQNWQKRIGGVTPGRMMGDQPSYRTQPRPLQQPTYRTQPVQPKEQPRQGTPGNSWTTPNAEIQGLQTPADMWGWLGMSIGDDGRLMFNPMSLLAKIRQLVGQQPTTDFKGSDIHEGNRQNQMPASLQRAYEDMGNLQNSLDYPGQGWLEQNFPNWGG